MHPPPFQSARTVWFSDEVLSLYFCSLLLLLVLRPPPRLSAFPTLTTPSRHHLLFGTVTARRRARTRLSLRLRFCAAPARLSLKRLVRALRRGSATVSRQEGNHDHSEGRQRSGQGDSAGPGTSALLTLTRRSRYFFRLRRCGDFALISVRR